MEYKLLLGNNLIYIALAELLAKEGEQMCKKMFSKLTIFSFCDNLDAQLNQFINIFNNILSLQLIAMINNWHILCQNNAIIYQWS